MIFTYEFCNGKPVLQQKNTDSDIKTENSLIQEYSTEYSDIFPGY